MRIERFPDKSTQANLIGHPASVNSNQTEIVMSILENVKKNGDKALFEYCRQINKANLQTLSVSDEEISKAEFLISEDLKKAIIIAKKNRIYSPILNDLTNSLFSFDILSIFKFIAFDKSKFLDLKDSFSFK